MMSHLCRSFSRLQIFPGITAACRTVPQVLQRVPSYRPATSISTIQDKNLQAVQPFSTSSKVGLGTLEYYHKRGKLKKKKKASTMWGKPQIKGVVVRVMIKKPRKPNSANRKCVRVRLSTGDEVTAYIPGEGHNLQEHSIVLIRGGNVQDLPGVKHKVVRGKHDLPHVSKG